MEVHWRHTHSLLDQYHSQVKFNYCDTGSPFEYELIRILHGMKREMDIQK